MNKTTTNQNYKRLSPEQLQKVINEARSELEVSPPFRFPISDRALECESDLEMLEEDMIFSEEMDRHMVVSSILKNEQVILNELLIHGLSADFPDEAGNTLLHVAASCSFKSVQTLLKHHADINAQNDDGETPLYIAVHCDRVSEVAYMLKRHADPNIPTVGGHSCLHLAVETDNLPMVQLLLNAGAELLTDRYGKFAYEDVQNEAAGYLRAYVENIRLQYQVIEDSIKESSRIRKL